MARPQQYRMSIAIACRNQIGANIVVEGYRLSWSRDTIIPRPNSNSDLQIISLTHYRYTIRTRNIYNDILRIRIMCIAIILLRNNGVILSTLLLYRIFTRYARCQATLVSRPWRTVTILESILASLDLYKRSISK